MDELLKEFWAAWKDWDADRMDVRVHGCNNTHRRRSAYVVDRLAARIRAVERANISRLPAGSHEDIPGQMYLTDMPVASLAVDESKRGAA